MKYEIYVDDFTHSLPINVKEWVGKRELILMDANILIWLARSMKTNWVRKLLVDWRKFGARAICGICDFIKIEALNAEKWRCKKRLIRRFLSNIEESAEGMYIELKTPIKDVEADSRSVFANILPKPIRRILIREKFLSGTDKCLILVAIYLKNSDFDISILTHDKILFATCINLGLKTRCTRETALYQKVLSISPKFPKYSDKFMQEKRISLQTHGNKREITMLLDYASHTAETG